MRLSPHVTHSGRQTHRSDRGSHLPLDEHLLDLGDGLGRVEALRAGLGAIHDRVAAVEPERVLKIVEPLAACLVAAVHDPAVRLQQDGRPEEALAGPPIAGTAGAAAGAENAFVESVDLGAVRGCLLPFLFRRRRDGLKPRLDRARPGHPITRLMRCSKWYRYSITSSARASTVAGTVILSTFAVSVFFGKNR